MVLIPRDIGYSRTGVRYMNINCSVTSNYSWRCPVDNSSLYVNQFSWQWKISGIIERESGSHLLIYTWAAPWQTKKMACAPSEDSDQPGHPPSLIRVFAVRMENTWILNLSIGCSAKTLIRLGGGPGWSESSLGARSFCWFCHEAAHLIPSLMLCSFPAWCLGQDVEFDCIGSSSLKWSEVKCTSLFREDNSFGKANLTRGPLKTTWTYKYTQYCRLI